MAPFDRTAGRLARGQGGGLAGRGGERVQQDDASQKHRDHDGNNLDDPEGQPELPAAPAPLGLPVPPGERARWLVVDVFAAFVGGRAASAKYSQLPSPPSVRTRLPLASTSGPAAPCPAHRNFLPDSKHVYLAAGRGGCGLRFPVAAWLR